MEGIGSNQEVDAVLTSILSKVNGVKGSLSSFIGKMEHEHLTWPSVLDSFSSVSSHTSNLMKQLSADRLPPLHTRVILPLMVSSEKDYELERQTEGRVPIMHHEVVPNYLRTKLSLELEAKQKERWSEARKSNVTEEQIKSYNKMLSSSLERITELKDEVEEKRTRTELVQSTLGETKKLVAAYLHGIGLSPVPPGRKSQFLSAGARQHQAMMGARAAAVRAPLRSDQRQVMTAPYQTMSPHKQQR